MIKKIISFTALLLATLAPAALADAVTAEGGAYIPTWIWLVVVAQLVVIIMLVSYITIKNNKDR